MAKTIVIVEDNSDKYTFEAIIKFMNMTDTLKVDGTEIPDNPNNKEVDWKNISDEANPEKPTALIKGLKGLLNDFSNEKYDKVAIIRDMDNHIKEDRLQLINTALKEAYPEEYKEITEVNKLVDFEFTVESNGEKRIIGFACHFVGIYKHDKKSGEIEDILKAIKKEDSLIADCVDEHLPICLKLTEEELKEKELVKLWINHYQRFDNLPKDKRTKEWTTWENVMKKRPHLFDFGATNTALNELKEFLKMMK